MKNMKKSKIIISTKIYIAFRKLLLFIYGMVEKESVFQSLRKAPFNLVKQIYRGTTIGTILWRVLLLA